MKNSYLVETNGLEKLGFVHELQSDNPCIDFATPSLGINELQVIINEIKRLKA